MDIDISTLMNSLFPTGTLLLALLLILAAFLHINNLNRVYKLMYKLTHENDSIKDSSRDEFKKKLYKEMTVSQGINFTALALASWIMFFVASAYLYLLVPTIFHYSYMDIPELPSNPMGFAIFGLLVAVLAAIIIVFLDKLPEDHRELKITELYSFYSISKGMKKLIGMTVIALCFSVLLSAYIGTIYPAHSLPAEIFSLLLLVLSAGILIMPIYKEAWEARR
ncbi:MAG: hypothetical protein JW999_05160 [Methanotrichaceae archaeon]|nr:hypothetical protein [Methanotrichaceae archaeon]